MDIVIRQETPEDYDAVYVLTKAAFAEEEHADGDEQDIAPRLRLQESYLPELSLVAELDGQIVGHILFTEITVGGQPALCLGIVSVLPERKRQGIGAALIHRGHEVAKGLGFSACVLVGHEDYYPRFGYEIASQYGISFPFDAPDMCKMVKFLHEDGKAIRGLVVLPPELVPEGS